MGKGKQGLQKWAQVNNKTNTSNKCSAQITLQLLRELAMVPFKHSQQWTRTENGIMFHFLIGMCLLAVFHGQCVWKASEPLWRRGQSVYCGRAPVSWDALLLLRGVKSIPGSCDNLNRCQGHHYYAYFMPTSRCHQHLLKMFMDTEAKLSVWRFVE